MRRSFQFKARLSPLAARKADEQLRRCCELYNAALQERRDAWKRAGVSVSANAQMKQLPEVKRVRPEYADIDAQVLQGVI